MRTLLSGFRGLILWGKWGGGNNFSTGCCQVAGDRVAFSVHWWEGDPPHPQIFSLRAQRGFFPSVGVHFWCHGSLECFIPFIGVFFGVFWRLSIPSIFQPLCTPVRPPYRGAQGLEDAAGCTLCDLGGILGCTEAGECCWTQPVWLGRDFGVQRGWEMLLVAHCVA